MPPPPPVTEPYRSGGTYGEPVPAPPPPPPAYGAPPPPPLSPGQGTVYQRAGGAQNNLLGWIGFVCGVLSTGCCCCPWLNGLPFLGGIPAIILGYLHLSRVKKGQASMSWLGWVAIVLGVIAIIGAICGLTTHWTDKVYNQYR
ncbi:hypothetical protein Cs7R123_33820 [Catellatospora sp. TT07R-123]|nr:hypothetical protein Cs7R123_33820 [Catellatospora sp. TT07R-123]